MREPLIVAAAQPSCVPRDVTANVVAHAAMVRAAAARVVVFPELSLTGYELDSPPIALEDPQLAPLIDACNETGTLALPGAPVPAGSGGKHIGMLAVDGRGARVAYRKLYLGGDEPDHFTPGDRAVVLEVDGWRLGLAICKDTGIPQHVEETAALGMDLYVVGVLEHREDAAVQEQRAHRIATRHRVWVAVASFAGAAGGGYSHAAGGSAIWTPEGEGVARAGTEPGTFARAPIK